MGCVRVSEFLYVRGKGIKLVLDGGDVYWDGDVDVGHFSGDGANGVENYVVVGVGGWGVLDSGVSEESEERE